MLKAKFVVPTIILIGGFLISTTSSYGRPQFTKQTKKACSFCHVDVKTKPKELKPAGKYFKEHHNSLEGYTEKK